MNLEYKYTPLAALKMSDEGPGTLEGLANASRELDAGGDIVTGYDDLEAMVQSGFAAESHDWSFRSVIGFILSAEETDEGLFARMQFHSTQPEQDIRTKARERMEAGKTVGLSIGYKPSGRPQFIYPDRYAEELPGLIRADRLEENLARAKGFNRIRVMRVAVKEFSIVTSPMNMLSQATAVKAMNEKRNSFITTILLRLVKSVKPDSNGGRALLALAEAEAAQEGRLEELLQVAAQKADATPAQLSDFLADVKTSKAEAILSAFVESLAFDPLPAEACAPEPNAVSEAELKAMFEDELAERNNNPYAYWDVFMCVLYRLIWGTEAASGMGVAADPLPFFDEAWAEFAARMRAWFAERIAEDMAAIQEEMGEMSAARLEEFKVNELFGRGPQVGMTLATHAAKVSDIIEGFKTRLEGHHGVLVVKEGRTYSAATRRRMKEHIDSLDAMVEKATGVRDDLQAMHDSTDDEKGQPPDSTDDNAQTLNRILKLRHEASALL